MKPTIHVPAPHPMDDPDQYQKMVEEVIERFAEEHNLTDNNYEAVSKITKEEIEALEKDIVAAIDDYHKKIAENNDRLSEEQWGADQEQPNIKTDFDALMESIKKQMEDN